MSEIKVFENQEFGQVRTVLENGTIWFVGKDVASTLGYAKAFNAISTHVDEDDTSKQGIIDNLGRNQETTLINESGLYSLILSSKLPTAKRFKKWVTNDVLPSIRQNGGYVANQEQMTPEEIVANALIVAKNIIENQKKEIETMIPKAEFFDQVTNSKDAIEMKDAAKVLNIKNMGRNNLFQTLRDKKILMENNTPFQTYIDRGYFRVIESKWVTPEGDTKINLKTVVYQKGLEFIKKTVIDTRKAF